MTSRTVNESGNKTAYSTRSRSLPSSLLSDMIICERGTYSETEMLKMYSTTNIQPHTHLSGMILLSTDISLSAIVDTILGLCCCSRHSNGMACLGSEATALRHAGHRGYSSIKSHTIKEASVPPTVTNTRSPYKKRMQANAPE